MSAEPAVDIAYLDGIRLQRGLQAGIRNVIAQRDHINAINVFPVADSDTGTNLALTMNAVLAGSRKRVQRDVSSWFTTISESALDGARGNSGAIFAQFLQGLADATGEFRVLTPKRYVAAAMAGARAAGEAIAEPRPGTMLSVIQDYANEVSAQCQRGVSDFRELLAAGLEGARQSLARTPEQLAVLKQAGVVDAGAQGFVYLLEGIQEYIDSGSLREQYEAPALNEDVHFEHESAAGGVEELAYRFCTECMVTGDGIDRRRLREALNELGGNSLVMAGTHRKVRIHMHVNEPGQLFERCEEFGEVSSCKADDMQLQTEVTHATLHKVAVVTDSVADIPESELERLPIHVVPLRVHFDNHQFLDGVTLSPEEFYRRVREGSVAPQTSQPPPGDFRRQYEFLESHFESVISITASSQVSGTHQATVAAAARSSRGHVTVFDSLNAGGAQGLLVMYAAEAAQAGMDRDQIIAKLEALRAQSWVYGAIDDLSYGVRGGRVPRAFKLIADLFRLRVVIGNSTEGRVTLRMLIGGRARMPQKVARRIARRLDPALQYRVIVGHCDAEEAGRQTLDELKARIPRLHSAWLTDAGTALGVHAGPGALVIGVQAYEPPVGA